MKELILKIIQEIANKMDSKRIGLTTGWLLLIILFTYTPLVKNLFQTGVFENSYIDNQNSAMALLVNVGLVTMLIIDFASAKLKVSYTILSLFALGFFLSIGVFGLCSIHYDNTYVPFIRCIVNIYLLHMFLFCDLFFLKYRSLNDPAMEIIKAKMEF